MEDPLLPRQPRRRAKQNVDAVKFAGMDKVLSVGDGKGMDATLELMGKDRELRSAACMIWKHGKGGFDRYHNERNP